MISVTPIATGLGIGVPDVMLECVILILVFDETRLDFLYRVRRHYPSLVRSVVWLLLGLGILMVTGLIIFLHWVRQNQVVTAGYLLRLLERYQ